MLSNIGGRQIESGGGTCLMSLKTEFQGLVANARSFLDCDLVGSLKEHNRRIDSDECGLCAAHTKRKVELSATVWQTPISEVANGGFILTHAGSSQERMTAHPCAP